jgi:hypothetical protein
LKERGDEKAELEDEKWLFDLAFLADFTGKLQGKNECIAEMITVSSYKSKFLVGIYRATHKMIQYLI